MIREVGSVPVACVLLVHSAAVAPIKDYFMAV